MKNFKVSLQEYADKVLKIALKCFDMQELSYDHICYQTISKNDYQDALKSLESDISVIKEIPHAGRLITVAKLKQPIKVRGVSIHKIEISEPKPKHTVKKRNFDHLAFVVKGDLDEFVSNLRSEGMKAKEAKQIGNDKLVKFIKNGVEIELRNNPIGEEAVTDNIDIKETEESNRNEISKSEVERLQNLLNDEKEKRLRALADYQNLEKRIANERKNVAVLTNSVILGQLLDILDDFDRALKGLKIDEGEQVGLRMVMNKIQELVDTNGLEVIKCSVGDSFDANVHEAVGVVATDENEANNSVKEIVQKGYKTSEGEQVVRPVRVIVCKKE